jgi:hypothetical protein
LLTFQEAIKVQNRYQDRYCNRGFLEKKGPGKRKKGRANYVFLLRAVLLRGRIKYIVLDKNNAEALSPQNGTGKALRCPGRISKHSISKATPITIKKQAAC